MIPSMIKLSMAEVAEAPDRFPTRLHISRGSKQIQERLIHGEASRTPRFLASASPKNLLHLKVRHLMAIRTKRKRRACRILHLLLLLGVTLKILTQRAATMMSTVRSMMRRMMSHQLRSSLHLGRFSKRASQQSSMMPKRSCHLPPMPSKSNQSTRRTIPSAVVEVEASSIEGGIRAVPPPLTNSRRRNTTTSTFIITIITTTVSSSSSCSYSSSSSRAARRNGATDES